MSTLPDQVAAAVWGRTMTRAGGTDPVRADTILRYAAHRSQVDSLAAQVAELAGTVAGLAEAVRGIAVGTVDLAAVQAAAGRGTTDALAGYTLRLDAPETEETA